MNEKSLEDRRFLVVEDDPLDLKIILEDIKVVVLGPARRVADTIALAEQIALDAAILNVRRELGTSLPLAEWLAPAASLFFSDAHR